MGLFGAGKKKTETIANLEAEVARLQILLAEQPNLSLGTPPGRVPPPLRQHASEQNLSRARQFQQQIEQLRREKQQVELTLRNRAAQHSTELAEAFHQLDAIWSVHQNQLEALKEEHARAQTEIENSCAERIRKKDSNIQALIAECAALNSQREELSRKLLVIQAGNMADSTQVNMRAMLDRARQLTGSLREDRDRLERNYMATRETLEAKERELGESNQNLAAKTTSLEATQQELETARTEQQRLSRQLEEHDSERQSAILERNRMRTDLGEQRRAAENYKRESLLKDAKLEFLQQLLVSQKHGARQPSDRLLGMGEKRMLAVPMRIRNETVSRQVSTPMMRLHASDPPGSEQAECKQM